LISSRVGPSSVTVGTEICSPDFRDLKFTPTFVEAGPEHLEGIRPDACSTIGDLKRTSHLLESGFSQCGGMTISISRPSAILLAGEEDGFMGAFNDGCRA